MGLFDKKLYTIACQFLRDKNIGHDLDITSVKDGSLVTYLAEYNGVDYESHARLLILEKSKLINLKVTIAQVGYSSNQITRLEKINQYNRQQVLKLILKDSELYLETTWYTTPRTFYEELDTILLGDFFREQELIAEIVRGIF